MSEPDRDNLVEERIAQLNVIVGRRNEFLREVFRMMNLREGVNASPVDDDDEEMELFLKRFDMRKNPDNGSISKLTDADISFPITSSTPTRPQVSTSPTDAGPSSSTRSLRRRTRADDATLERSRAPGALEKAIAARSHDSSRYNSPPSARRRFMEIDSDEDNDELDLISSYRAEGESPRPPATKPDSKGAIKPSSPLEALHPQPRPKASVSQALPQIPQETPNRDVPPTRAEVEAQESKPETQESKSPPPENPTKQVTKMEVEEEEESKEDDASKEKEDEAMEVEEVEVETMTKGSEQDSAPEKESPAPTAIVTKAEPSANATADPVETVSKATSEVPSRESSQAIQPSSAPSSLPPTPQKARVVPIQVQSSVSQEDNAFKMDTAPDSEPKKVVNASLEYDSMGHFHPNYFLPPLNVLPTDFTKKAKPIKRSKKEKESKREREDTVPLGLAKWSATVMANPVWRRVSRATKTLSTRDWSVAMTELRLVRTIERIESLKNDGRWSFRQPKKQRGVGGLTKSHWDYLLEEMKWMRVDFREERRWKLALAYDLSTAVLEWHYLKTREEREEAGIVVKWRRPQTLTLRDAVGESSMSMEMSSDDLPAASVTKSTATLLGLDYGSDEEEGEPGSVHDVIDPLAPSAAVEEAVEAAASEAEPKREEDENAAALQLARIDDTPEEQTQPAEDTKTEDDTKKALKSSSDNPLLSGAGSKSSSQSVNGDSDPAPPMSKKAVKSALNPIRERVVHSDDLFLDIGAELQNLNIKSKSKDPDLQSIHDVQLLFPDLQPFGIFDVAPGPPMVVQEEKKRKSKERSDREDPNKRLEDTTYTKLYPIGRFMQSKPTLIGPLQPAKRFQDGKWLPIDPVPVAPEPDAKIPDDLTNELFEGRPANASSGLSLQFHGVSFNRAKRAEQLWNQADDALLRHVVDRYSSNWALVAEVYNSSRLTTTTERRTPMECMERWKERWSSEKRMQAAAEAAAPPMPSSDDVASSSAVSSAISSSAQSQMTTRGVKRLASASVSSSQGIQIGGEKKRRRHFLLHDSIKRAAKKRTDTIQKMIVNQRKPSAVHDTHNQYNKLPKLTPIELARMKADRDQRESAEFLEARRRQQEALRLNMLREQQQRAGQQPANGPTPPQAQQAQPAQATPVAQSTQPVQPAAATPQVPAVQGGQAQQPVLPQLQPQQLAQLQQLQAQQAQQAGRMSGTGVGVPNRPPTRMNVPNAANVRPNPQAQAQTQAAQLQLLQAARQQLPMHLQPGAQANLAQALSQVGNPYYANISLTPDQLVALQQMQQQHQQQQAQQQQQQPQQAQQPAASGVTTNGFTNST